ncbi:MAG TPA: hypothetical protein VG944_12515 [Fimbriimonas sp.]|nr:hypothetical protein [Fimbriimonas sp.]
MKRALFLVPLLVWSSAALAQGGHSSRGFGHRGQRSEWASSPLVPQVLKEAIRHGAHARFYGRRKVHFAHGNVNVDFTEIVYRDGPRTRSEFPDGSRFAGQIIVEDGHVRKEFYPDKNEVIVKEPRHEENLERLVRLARRGADGRIVLTKGPGMKVAGHWTVQIVVQDKDGNPLQRLYVEPKHGMMLKREIFDQGGAKIGYFVFDKINFDPPPFDPSLFRFSRRGVRVITPYDVLRDVASKAGFAPTFLPRSSGYKLEDVRVANRRGEDVLVETYGSRQGRLSLFELKTDVSPDRLHQFERDELHAVTWQAGGKTYVIVGAASSEALANVARSIGYGTP